MKLEQREHRRERERKVQERRTQEKAKEEERPKLEGRSSGANEKDQETGGVCEVDWKNDEQEGKCTYADGGVFEGDWKNDGREGGQEHVDVRRRGRVRGRLQERQDGGQVHVHRRGRVRGRLEKRRAQEEGGQVELKVGWSSGASEKDLETWKRASKNDAPESHRNAGATACASARTSSARGKRPSRVRGQFSQWARARHI